jgi:glycogen operon protein
LADPGVIGYLKSLGITSAELLPIHAFVDDDYLLRKGLRNYWGYNSIGFFAPDPRYLHSPFVNEFKETVNQFHSAGVELILDVVYNHTAEGNELGPTISFKGIDNASYYRLLPDQKRFYINDTGTGNTVNLSHQRVLQMVADSLRYWAQDMRVDGFRFDLATILAREPYGFDEGGGFLDACRQDPVLSQIKLIAEPWDIGPGGYQVGRFPPGWAEWNDKFRDTVRSFWKGDEAQLPDLAKRITASGDLFNRRGRKPWATVNFITAHDGFTLHDLVSYNDKHNEANGGTTVTAIRTITRSITAWRVEPTIQRSRKFATGRSGIFWRPSFSRKARQCCLLAMSSGARRTATTTPTARITT